MKKQKNNYTHTCDKCHTKVAKHKVKFPDKNAFMQAHDKPIRMTIRELCEDCARPYLANKKKNEKVTV